ncbi:predicted protein [Nematostella vectensis]|uniref:Transmembrane protein 11 homolog, mitochondrial n=1 Tax=Nematostella vectensis TaxID=45351 RepID=A7S0W5_NEMVE|nr:predicted protein [Nematostella vectensis]|eukprot:XP_001634676.1 predicted protein [Nematostella vectensis]
MACSPSEEELARSCVTIQEIYDSEDAQEEFEVKLENALESGITTIIIEPTKLGEETARWIQVGNCLHKTSVLTGIGALLSPVVMPGSYKTPSSLAFGGVSVFCALMYGVSWQFDPCCKYQIEYDTKKLARLPVGTTTSPIVLIRTDDKYRKILHNVIASSSAAFCAWKIYDWYFK